MLQKYKKVLISALNGHYDSADEMKREMLAAGQKAAQRKQAGKTPTSAQSISRQRQQNMRQGKVTQTRYAPKKKGAKSGGLFETALIVISVLALYFAYIIFFLI